MRKMKDSGVAWLESIPETWNLLQLGSLFLEHKHKNVGMQSSNLLSLSYGKIIQKNINATDGLLPESFEGYNVIDAGDIVLRLTDLQNDQRSLRVGLCGESGIITSAYTTLRRRNDALNSKYFYYLLHSYDIRKGFYGMGAGVRQGLNYAGVRKIMLTVPPESEQTAIAECLDRKTAQVDALISNVQAQIEKLKAYKQSLITEVVTKGLDPNVPMMDSGVEWIGEIPSSWNTIRVKQLLRERNERSVDGKEEPLSMSQKVGLVPTKTLDSIPNMASSFVGAKLAYVDDLVFNKLKAHLGVFSVSKYDGLVSPDYAVYYSTGVADLKYLEYLFKTPQCISEFRKRSTGIAAGLTRLYTDGLFAIECPFPSKDKQHEIVAHLNKKCAQIDELTAIKQTKIEKLEQYKRSLIYEYVTGKKEVS